MLIIEMSIKITFLRIVKLCECNICYKTYRYKHTCFEKLYKQFKSFVLSKAELKIEDQFYNDSHKHENKFHFSECKIYIN